jgi:hypothetical protein
MLEFRLLFEWGGGKLGCTRCKKLRAENKKMT